VATLAPEDRQQLQQQRVVGNVSPQHTIRHIFVWNFLPSHISKYNSTVYACRPRFEAVSVDANNNGASVKSRMRIARTIVNSSAGIAFARRLIFRVYTNQDEIWRDRADRMQQLC